MKILVLGSDGQIGKPLVEYLKSLNHEVIGFDNYSNLANDLRIPGIIDDLLSGIDFVYFLAFDVGGSGYLKNYQDTYPFISNNIMIMDNTFKSLKKYNTRFIFASSQMAMMNDSSYGSLKRIGEYFTSCMNGKTVRLWNVYGLEHETEKFHVISDFIIMAKYLGRINIKTFGNEQRQFLYVNDCCKCLVKIMSDFDIIKNKTIAVSSFKWTTVNEIADIIATQFNCLVYRGSERDDIQRQILSDPDSYILKYWKPETSLIDGIKQIINGLDTR